jgi:hypothetical protein
MTAVFLWVGFVAVTGAALALAGWLWWLACYWVRASAHETWWITSWMLVKTGQANTFRARVRVVEAIAQKSEPEFYDWLWREVQRTREEAREAERAIDTPIP